ncbi:unnamed protein product, partial [Onchocerca ochengi]|uniref:KH_dom_type_1 domain-containing protein n=1 Tax=Onchocerca ochengi TaxID=42157 RepID=A0A182DYP7_ONCOC
PCQREWVIRIPDRYVSNGAVARKIMDLGEMNLEVELEDEDQEYKRYLGNQPSMLDLEFIDHKIRATGLEVTGLEEFIMQPRDNHHPTQSRGMKNMILANYGCWTWLSC